VIYLDLKQPSSCISGQVYTFDKETIEINYDSADVYNKIQKGLAPIIVTCE